MCQTARPILRCLTEGNSINSTTRICHKSKLTVLRLLADVGMLCAELHDELVRGLECKRVQVDEIWSFVGCKEKSRKQGKMGDGDAWTWSAIDADSKLIVSYLVGLRELSYAKAFIDDTPISRKDLRRFLTSAAPQRLART